MRIWPFSRVPKPSPLRLRDLDERLTDVEKAIEWLKKADKDLNARLATVQRKTAPGPAVEATPDAELAAPQIRPTVFPRERSRRGF